MNQFEEVIKAHLEGVAEKDTEFAKKYNPEKVGGCCRYIMKEAQKRAQDGCAVIADEEVYGWAIHFFDEGLEDPKEEVSCRVETTADPIVMRAKVEIPKPTPKPKKVDDVQMSLFDFDDED